MCNNATSRMVTEVNEPLLAALTSLSTHSSKLLVAWRTLLKRYRLCGKHADQLAASVEIAARAGDAQEIQKAMAGFDREETGLLAAVESFISGRNP